LASTGVTLTNQSGVTLDLAAGATATLTVPNAVSMSNSSDNSCQGAVFTVPVSLTAVATRSFVMRLLPAVVATALTGCSSSRLPSPVGRAAPRVRPALKVSGLLRYLYPGARRPLPLVIRNNRGFRIRVVSLTVRVRNAKRGCGRRYLRIGRYRWRLIVPPHGFRTTALPVTILRSAPDACKRAVFPLRFTARGRKA
jgi:hypothetical protein